MCDLTEGCDGELDQTNRCNECGADALEHDPSTFSGGSGARRHPTSDEEYREQIEKLER